MVEVRALARAELASAIDDLAGLRIEVFREWPYLYDGDLDYERRYLRPYLDSDASIVVGAFEDGHLVGAATGAPMEDHAEDFARPLTALALPLTDIFYFAESVLLPGYRGQGIGHRFFDLREAHARERGRRHAVFCAVDRPADHPARPQGYRPLDTFWTRRGYAPVEGAIARFAWRDIGEPRETRKPLRIWMRAL